MTQPYNLDAAGQELLHTVDKLAQEVVAAHAQDVDKNARFPEESIAALRKAGLLGLVSAKAVGGKGQGLRTAAAVVERLASDCPSTAMILKMHYCATAVIEAHGDDALRRRIAEQQQLATLAFSESGSRSHFWVPVSTATPSGGDVVLDADKQMITSAGQCKIYVWSSKPASAAGLSSIWWVDADAPGIEVTGRYEGMGLRGNCSAPIRAKGVRIAAGQRLGADGAGFEVMMGVVLPWFCLQNQAVSTGISQGAVRRTVGHITGSTYGYSGAAISHFPQVRSYVAQMVTKTDLCRALLIDGISAIETGRQDAELRVLQAKVTGAETAIEVLDMAMRATGGAAYRKATDLERFFRDSRAASVMAPVTDALWDFIGKAACGLPLFD